MKSGWIAYQCGLQPRIRTSRIIVPMTETAKEPRQPRRLEKKANICRTSCGRCSPVCYFERKAGREANVFGRIGFRNDGEAWRGAQVCHEERFITSICG